MLLLIFNSAVVVLKLILYVTFPNVEFHPRLIGLTGSPDEIRNVARAYRVYYMKTAEEGSDYLVDHSIVMYVLSFLPSLMPEFLT